MISKIAYLIIVVLQVVLYLQVLLLLLNLLQRPPKPIIPRPK